MKTTTLKAIIRAFNTASKEEHRVTLAGVYLEAEGETVRVVATDGHSLSLQILQDEGLLASLKALSKPFFISYAYLPYLKALAKQYKIPMEIACSFDNGSMIVGDAEHSLKIKDLDVTIPGYRHVMPKEDAYTVEIGLNPKYLLEVFKSLNEESRSTGLKLCINPSDKFAPIIVKHNDQYGLVMPMRL